MPKVSIGLDASIVVEARVLSGVRNAQDAVEAVVRDYVARGHRTDAVTGDPAGAGTRPAERERSDLE